jgi:hypothetical protein
MRTQLDQVPKRVQPKIIKTNCSKVICKVSDNSKLPSRYIWCNLPPKTLPHKLVPREDKHEPSIAKYSQRRAKISKKSKQANLYPTSQNLTAKLQKIWILSLTIVYPSFYQTRWKFIRGIEPLRKINLKTRTSLAKRFRKIRWRFR